MGIDITASLFYGFYLGDEDENPWTDWDADRRLHYEDWLSEKLGNDSNDPIDVHLVGHCEFSTYYLVISRSVTRDCGWEATRLDLTAKPLYNNEPEWDKILKQYAEKLGIKYEQPCWHVGAFYSH